MIRAAKDYGVEVVVAYENKRVGQVIYPPGTLRQKLIMCGLVKARASDEPAPVKAGNLNKPMLKLTR